MSGRREGAAARAARPGGHLKDGVRDYQWNRRPHGRPGPHRNNIRPMLLLAKVTEAEAGEAIWGPDSNGASLLNRHKNGLVMPSIKTAWMIVRGFERLLGRPVRIEEVFPPDIVLGGEQ